MKDAIPLPTLWEEKPFTTSLILTREGGQFNASIACFRESFDILYARHRTLLHPIELKEFQHFHVKSRQYSYLLGRFSAKFALCHYLKQSLDFKNIGIQAGVFSHPVLISPEKPNIHISISHHSKLATALLCEERHPMAIDIEQINQTDAELILPQLSKDERNILRQLNLNKATALTMMWSMKEALSKVIKCGFTLPQHILSISSITQNNEGYCATFTYFSQYKALSYTLDDTILSVTLPCNSHGHLQIEQLRDWHALQNKITDQSGL